MIVNVDCLLEHVQMLKERDIKFVWVSYGVSDPFLSFEDIAVNEGFGFTVEVPAVEYSEIVRKGIIV